MKEHEKDHEFTASAKRALDRSLEAIEANTLARLKQARQRAVESVPARVPRFVWAGGLATAFAALLVAAVLLFQPGSSRSVPTLEDVEIWASSEGLDFYDELEFYHWLADAEFAG